MSIYCFPFPCLFAGCTREDEEMEQRLGVLTVATAEHIFPPTELKLVRDSALLFSSQERREWISTQQFGKQLGTSNVLNCMLTYELQGRDGGKAEEDDRGKRAVAEKAQ